MRKSRAARALAVFLVGLGLAGCAAKAEPVPELLEPVGMRMDTEPVRRGEIAEWRAYDFFVVPETMELSLPEGGVVQEISVELGQTVEAGDVLLRMDVEDERERIAEIEEELAYREEDNALTIAGMQMDIELCKYQMEDDNRDYKAGGEREQLKENELHALEAALEQEQARQALEREQLLEERQTLQERVTQSALIAPEAGRVVYLADLSNGVSAQSGQTLVVLAQEGQLRLKGEYLTEAEAEEADEVIAWIGGERVPIAYAPMDTDDYIASLLAGEELSASFTFPEGVPEGTQAGAYAAVLLKTIAREGVLYVPPDCLFRDGGETYVYRVVDGERVRTEVEAGYRSVNAAEIVSGLSEGDVVYVP
ncbi:MAG: efflux RND transporter periplasmic adaptor subunit [Candidatus Spyradocola sp.]|jgi:multidrug efflux pump subunit AcrA (membrane-fusion protein)